jgi:hypothetical protein
MDLPYIYSTKGVLKEPNLAKEAAEGLFSAVSAYSRGDVMGAASSIFSLAKTAISGDGAYNKTKETRTSPADVIMWSGSKDSQTSYVPPFSLCSLSLFPRNLPSPLCESTKELWNVH